MEELLTTEQMRASARVARMAPSRHAWDSRTRSSPTSCTAITCLEAVWMDMAHGSGAPLLRSSLYLSVDNPSQLIG